MSKNKTLLTVTLVIVFCLGLACFLKFLLFHTSDQMRPPINENPLQPNVNSVAKIGSMGYDSLANAIQASHDDDVIELLRDIDEQVTIFEKSLSIIGNGHTIRYPNSIGPSTDFLAGMIQITGGTVTLKDIILDGKNAMDKSLPSKGIAIKEANIVLDGVTIRNINHQSDQLSKSPNGVSIYVFNETGPISLMFQNVTIENFHRYGIQINNKAQEAVELQMEGCTITGIGDTKAVEQIGCFLSGIINGKIRNNQFSDMNYREADGNGIGIYLLQQGNLLSIINNDFQNIDIEQTTQE